MIKKQIEADALLARKAKDTAKLETLNAAKNAFQMLEIANKNATESDYITAINKLIKQYRETADYALQAGPTKFSLSKECHDSIDVLEAYLPKSLSIDEVKKLVNEVVAENNLELVKKNMGNIVKLTVSKASGQTDGKTVSTIVTELITAQEA